MDLFSGSIVILWAILQIKKCVLPLVISQRSYQCDGKIYGYNALAWNRKKEAAIRKKLDIRPSFGGMGANPLVNLKERVPGTCPEIKCTLHCILVPIHRLMLF